MPHNTTIQAYTALAVKFHLLPKHFNDDSSAPPSGQNPIAVKFKDTERGWRANLDFSF